jgi:hypothetical protein
VNCIKRNPQENKKKTQGLLEMERKKPRRLVPPKKLEKKTSQGIDDKVKPGDLTLESAVRVVTNEATKQQKIERSFVKLDGMHGAGEQRKLDRPGKP